MTRPRRIRSSHAHRPGTITLLTLLVSLIWSAEPLLGQASYGPLTTAEQNPLYRFFHVPSPESADLVDPGNLRMQLNTSYSNIFERSGSARHDQLFDLEQMTNTVAVRYGIARPLEAGAALSLHTGWGGFLDPFISGFHRMFGFPNGGREEEAGGQHRIHLVGVDPQVWIDLPQRTLDPESVRGFLQWRFLGATTASSAVSLRGELRRSVDGIDPGRMDAALSMHARYTGEGVFLHGSLGVTTLDAPAPLEPVATDRATFFSFGVEGMVRPRLSFIGQMTGTTPYLEGFDAGELSGMPVTFALGFAGETGGGWEWQASFVEDFPPNSPSADLTLNLGIARSLRAFR